LANGAGLGCFDRDALGHKSFPYLSLRSLACFKIMTQVLLGAYLLHEGQPELDELSSFHGVER